MIKRQISVITALEGKCTVTSVKRLRVTVYECVCQKRRCPVCDTKAFTTAPFCHDNNEAPLSLSLLVYLSCFSFCLSVSFRALSSSSTLPKSWDSCPSWRYNMFLLHLCSGPSTSASDRDSNCLENMRKSIWGDILVILLYASPAGIFRSTWFARRPKH